MLFRYDFDQKLDLTLFKKQGAHYINQMEQTDFYLVFQNYRMEICISTSDKTTQHLATISICEISRDADGEINSFDFIIPSSDLRFKEITDIAALFPIDHRVAYFESSSVEKTMDTICKVAKILHRINNLKAFL